MARRHSSAANSSSTSITAVRSWRRASWVISPCTRAWAPNRGGLAGMWETKRILRRSGLTEPIWAARHAAAGPCYGGGAAHGGYWVHSSESRVLRGNFCESKWATVVGRGQDWPVLRASNRASPSSADKGANSDQFLQRQEQTSPTLNCRRASTSFQGGYGT